MSAPPWGHKPPRVDDIQEYWSEAPESLSPRVQYWLQRLADGTWKPNHRFNSMGYYDRAQYLGVYLWEYLNVIYPILCGEDPTMDTPEEDPSLRRTLAFRIQP